MPDRRRGARGRIARGRRWVVWFGSDILRGRQERRRAMQDLRNGREPQPRYTTGKHWED